jgi:hypothetical protein
MVICFRGRFPVFRTDEAPGTVTIDVPITTQVSYGGSREPPPELAIIHKGEALNRYSLPPGVWFISVWRVNVFRNGSNKPWSVALHHRQPFASVTVPDYEPPKSPPKLRLAKDGETDPLADFDLPGLDRP